MRNVHSNSSMLLTRTFGGAKGSSNDEFDCPRASVFDCEGENESILVADQDNKRIKVVNAKTGAWIRNIAIAGNPTGLSLERSREQLWVTLPVVHRVLVINKLTGTVVHEIGGTGGVGGRANNQFNSPIAVCVDEIGGCAYISDMLNNRIQVYSLATGVYERTIGPLIANSKGEMTETLMQPYCLSVCRGLLYVADRNHHRVLVLNKKTGAILSQIGTGMAGTGINQLNLPIDVCVDEVANLIFICDYGNHRVLVFERETLTLLRQIGTTSEAGVGPTHLNNPRCIALDSHTGLFFISYLLNRVLMYEVPESREERDKLVSSSSTLTKDMTSLLDGGHFADVTIYAGPSRVAIKVHGNILSVRS